MRFSRFMLDEHKISNVKYLDLFFGMRYVENMKP